MCGAITFVACATQKVPYPVGGSRSDATVELAYQYGEFERPQVDWEAAGQLAAQRCQAWGYLGAEPFGGQLQECAAYNQYGCYSFLVKATYQCTGEAP
jgi:hypothetical protein